MVETSAKLHCPLCAGKAIEHYHTDRVRAYYYCNICSLVFVPPVSRLSREEEKAVYDLHVNEVDDPGYRRFLSRVVDPLLERLQGRERGLDFGCGPGPALAAMLQEKEFEMTIYDPIYYDNPMALRNEYDFLCATEVVEHFHDPSAEFASLFRLVKPGGWLAIMTKLVIDRQAFTNWHYIRDLTHVSFFSRATFVYLAELYGAEMSMAGNDVIFLRKYD